jgi:hypothetical protein
VVFVSGGGRVFAQSVGNLCDEFKFVHLLGCYLDVRDFAACTK